MFEDRTDVNIRNEMLELVSDAIDKRQGSIIFDSISPVSVSLAQFYFDLTHVSDLGFIDTSVGEFLDRKGVEFAITRRAAVKSERAATFVGATPTVGAEFFGLNTFWVYLENGNVEAVTSGIIGNTAPVGTNLIPSVSIPGLTSATLGAVVVPGSDIETDVSYRARIVEKINEPQINSNRAQIRAWSEGVDGIGRAKVFPLEFGPNTVESVLVNSQGEVPSQTLVDAVQNLIDPPDAQSRKGLGEGLAAIGLIFTATAATALPINVDVDVTSLASGFTLQDAEDQITAAVTMHLQEIAFVEDVIRIAEISSIIFNLPAILDFQNLQLNAQTGNIQVPEKSIGTIGTVTVT